MDARINLLITGLVFLFLIINVLLGATINSGFPNVGTRFILSMVRQPQTAGKESCKLLLYNPSPTNITKITVHHSLKVKINNDHWTVGPLMTSWIDIPDEYGLNKTIQMSNKGFEIMSTIPIKLKMINIGSFSGDSTMVFPYTELGSQYFVITPCNASSTYSQVQIVSTNIRTMVLVTLPGDRATAILTLYGKVYHGGEKINVTLGKYTVLHLTSMHSLTGALISSTDIVSVFTGCDYDFLDYTGQTNTENFYHKVEHAVDRTRLGRSFDFVAVETCRATIVASQAQTTLTVSKETHCQEYILVNEGDKLEIALTIGIAVVFSSNHPILVAVDSGRDFFLYLTPWEQQISKTTFCVDHQSKVEFSMSIDQGCGLDFSANGNNMELNKDILKVKCYDDNTKCFFTSREYINSLGCFTVENSCGFFHGGVIITATQSKTTMEESLGNAMTIVSPSCSSGAVPCLDVVVSCVSTTTSVTTISSNVCENGGSMYTPNVGNTLCYWITALSTSATDAKQKCKDSNGMLALIPDPGVNNFIAELITAKGYTGSWFYIGYKFVNNELRSMTNNDKQSWAEWEQGEPSTLQNEDHVAVRLVANILKWYNVMMTGANFRSLCMSTLSTTTTSTKTTTTTTKAPVTTTATEAPVTTTSTKAPVTTTATEAPITTPSAALTTASEIAISTDAPCNCTCTHSVAKNLTVEVLEEIQRMKKELEVDKTTLSSAIRSKTSAEDPRPSATYVGGTFSVVFVTLIFGGLVLMDFPVLMELVKRMMAFFKKIT